MTLKDLLQATIDGWGGWEIVERDDHPWQDCVVVQDPRHRWIFFRQVGTSPVVEVNKDTKHVESESVIDLSDPHCNPIIELTQALRRAYDNYDQLKVASTSSPLVLDLLMWDLHR